METDMIEEAVREWWGERCPDFDFTCACCQAWLQFDKLVGGKDD